MKYKEGEIVSVKIAGLVVSGIIKEKKNTGEYIVQFDGGAEQLVGERLIKPLDSNMPVNEILNSPSRRSPSRRSPARAASPSRRAKAKSPSPSRRKSPSRKSPSRILKVSLENIEAKESSPVHVSFPRRRKPIEHTEEVSKFQSVTEITKVFTINNGFDPGTFSKETVQVDKEKDKIIHLKQPTYLLEDLSSFSDGEVIETTTTDAPEKLRKSEPKPVFPPREFGGWFGALLLMILMPTFALAMHVFCNKDFCSYIQLPDLQQYKFVSTFFDLHAAYLYFGYIALIALLNKIPFGGRKITSMPSNYKKQIYCMNGFFSIFVVHACIVALEYYNVPIVNTLYEKYFQLLCTAIVFGLSLSICVYFKSKFVPLSCLNSHGFTNNTIYDFFVGREIHPKLLGIDIKALLFRSSLIAVLVINSIFIFKSMDVVITNTDNMLSVGNITYDPALLVSSMLQIFYIFDIFFFESALVSCFELQSEGVGYFSCMMYSLKPFMLTAVTKYFYEYELAVCPWRLLGVCIVFFLGYALFRGANSQKNAFRRNPYDPALAYLETMSTSQGKKLLVSGYWGLVRHPNYIGDILIHLAIGALCVTSPAALGALPSTILLVHRASRIDARCKRRYGSYWDRYCQKVKYQLIPKIY